MGAEDSAFYTCQNLPIWPVPYLGQIIRVSGPGDDEGLTRGLPLQSKEVWFPPGAPYRVLGFSDTGGRDGDTRAQGLGHRWQTQGLRAGSSPPPCFAWPSTLFLPSGSAELSLNC